MITLLKIFPEKWEQAKGYLRLDLEAIEAALNTRWAIVFGDSNLLQPGAVDGDFTLDSRYISNQGPGHMPLWDQVNLSNGVKGRLPFSNLVAATLPSVLVGRRSTSAGDFEQITIGAGLAMHGQTLDVDLSRLQGATPIPDEPYRDDPWPTGNNGNATALATAFTPGSVVFAGPAGFLAQDNAQLFWDDPNNRLGVGTPSPAETLHVSSATAAKGRVRVDETDTGGVNVPGFAIYNETAFKGGWFYDEAADNLELWNGAARVVTYPAATAGAFALIGGQLKFPTTQNPSADPTTMDDYREDTWTPTDVSGAGLAFAFAAGTYVKVGKLVFVSFQIVYPATASGATALIGNLPFTASSTNDAIPIGYNSTALAISGHVVNASTTYQPTTAVSVANLTNAQLSNANIIITGTYRSAN